MDEEGATDVAGGGSDGVLDTEPKECGIWRAQEAETCRRTPGGAVSLCQQNHSETRGDRRAIVAAMAQGSQSMVPQRELNDHPVTGLSGAHPGAAPSGTFALMPLADGRPGDAHELSSAQGERLRAADAHMQRDARSATSTVLLDEYRPRGVRAAGDADERSGAQQEKLDRMETLTTTAPPRLIAANAQEPRNAPPERAAAVAEQYATAVGVQQKVQQPMLDPCGQLGLPACTARPPGLVSGTSRTTPMPPSGT